jgi:ribosomal-protein-alanine N-acetyltransferase
LLEIRRMTEQDVDMVWAIEIDLFSMPWSKTSFLYEVSDNRVCIPIVALDGETLVGYAIAWFVSDEIHIGNIAVARGRQCKGIGRQLLEDLLTKAFKRGVKYATLEVRVGNVKAINLYRKYGFEGIAIRKAYYRDNSEDALVMLAEMRRIRHIPGPWCNGKSNGGRGGLCMRV